MIFKTETFLFIIISLIGVIYCSPEGEKCCGDVFEEAGEKSKCSAKLDEELQNGILPKDKHSEIVTKACKAVTEVKEHFTLTPAQFGFLVSLGKEEKTFYEDFLYCFPTKQSDEVVFNLSKTEGLVKHNLYDLPKAMSAGGAKWWTHLNILDDEYLDLLKEDDDGKYKLIALNPKFQEFYYNYKQWVAGDGDVQDCDVRHVFDAFHYNPQLAQQEPEVYKNNAIDGVKYFCKGYHNENHLAAATATYGKPAEGEGKAEAGKETPKNGESKNGERPKGEPKKEEGKKEEGKKEEAKKEEAKKVEPKNEEGKK